MITLRNKLYESLLDDEDELTNNDKGIVQDILNDLTSDFYKEYNNKGIVKDMAKLEGDIVVFPDYIKLNHENNKEHKPISYYLPGIDSIKVNGVFQINAAKDLKEFDDKYICKNLYAENFIINLGKTETIKDVNFIITDKHVDSSNRISIHNLMPNSGPILFKNVTIKSDLPWMFLYIKTNYMPQFKNVYIDGCKSTFLKIYDINMGNKGDDITDKINSLLDLTYKSAIYDNNKQETIYKKSDIKSIQAIINNDKRYKIISDLFKLKPGAKLSNIIDNIPNNVKTIYIHNNVCSVVFELDPNNLIKDRLPYYSNLLGDGWSMRIIDR